MSIRALFTGWGCVALLASLSGIGCEALTDSATSGRSLFSVRRDDTRDEIKYRERFRTDRDPEAMRWLLANRVRSGMTAADINGLLGDTGEREFNDRWLKTNGGLYRSGDVVYRWGPDNEGHSVYLVFREDRLVNFDPKEFE